ncbi:MAG: hypothetical protein M1479_02795 [Actinobacteria bacterium]|nr:hypothetical protein [Cyanobacteriota bacterium]MCL5771186.1 hypothetical protein [Actinomycetota bacterium]
MFGNLVKAVVDIEKEIMAIVGSEVIRALSWQEKGNKEYCTLAFKRAIELPDYTTEALNEKHRLKELKRLREALVDYFFADNSYGSTPEAWKNYFLAFNYAARFSVGRL